jgi:hypothetical protein
MLHFNLSKILQPVNLKKLGSISLLFSLSLQLLLPGNVLAASSPWTQTDWSGGSGQASWSNITQFSSSSGVTTSTAGEITLTATEELSNTGFESNLTGWSSSTQTLNLQPDGTAGIDTYVASNAVTTNNDGLANLLIGETSGAARIQRALLKFDLSSIPSSATLTSTILSLYINQDSSTTARTFRVYRSKRAWVENQATWQVYATATAWQTAGGFGSDDTEQTDIGSASFSDSEATGVFKDFTLTPTTTGALDLGNGWMVKADTETDDAYRFDSSDSATAANRPKLAVSYTFDTRDTTTTYSSSSGSAKLAPGTNGAGTFTQSVNVGDTNTYNFSAYAYTDGSAVSSSDLSLYYNGSTVSTTYTSVGSGWYRLTGTLTGVNSSVGAGVQVASGKTVYVDNFSLGSYSASGTMTSSIFDTEASSAWGTLTYTATAPTNTTVSVKVRTSNSSSMTGATDFSSCTAISSGSDISSNGCITDGHRYIQYLVTLSTSDTSATSTFSDISIAFSTSDSTAPSISLTAISPDPTTDQTPSITGTATEGAGTVSAVQFQMDSTSGSWSSCSADDGSFDEVTETFTCLVSSALNSGSHTIYVRATDSAGNTTSSGSESADTFTVSASDAIPGEIEIIGPDGDGYTNGKRPNFIWKSDPDEASDLSKYTIEVDNGADGDFGMDNIPVERTTNYDTSKYFAGYENFSDNDSTNNYIRAYTKSSTDWASSNNDGELKEGKRSWTIKAWNTAGNIRSHERALYADFTSPQLVISGINGVEFINGKSYATVRRQLTISGKLTDVLAGAYNDNKVASGPKSVEVKIEKKNITGVYDLYSLSNLSITDSYFTLDNAKITDNTKQLSDKYANFSYTHSGDLSYGIYKLTVTGMDKAGNKGGSGSFLLTITSDNLAIPSPTPSVASDIPVNEDNSEEAIELQPEGPLEVETIVLPDQEAKTPLFEKLTAFVFGSVRTVYWGSIGAVNIFDGAFDGWKYAFDRMARYSAAVARSAPGAIGGITRSIILGGERVLSAAVNGTVDAVSWVVSPVSGVFAGVGNKLAATFDIWFNNNPTYIADVDIIEIGSDFAIVEWKTNHHTRNNKINYGESLSFGSSVQAPELEEIHRVRLEGLKPNTEYYFEVMSQGKNYVYDAHYTFRTGK